MSKSHTPNKIGACIDDSQTHEHIQYTTHNKHNEAKYKVDIVYLLDKLNGEMKMQMKCDVMKMARQAKENRFNSTKGMDGGGRFHRTENIATARKMA